MIDVYRGGFMKTIISVLLISISVLASKKSYDLKMELSIDGKQVSIPSVVVEEGVHGTITKELVTQNSYVEVIATEENIQGNKGILMKFEVGHFKKDGSRVIISNPIVLANEGEEASISIEEEDGIDKFSLKVIAKRNIL
jgi:hypothetical protein